ncbi:DUF3164 family protein [Vibrio scophthalmi]|uniref:Sulfate transporter n=1 Tax=Vibrio ichthyoenteri ATCC 700023 TaxID=870968 RepID=F9S302_9VIBR|nr:MULTISPECIES: DUF3164 family protein [Vibrio]ANS86957.1 hypothetical protein VSVS12_03248 [Vibrio scophthalmi]EGU38561.1 hypothetical protein VII00023_10539 [Vibrio ichthyoenteri ATCC 700023]
MNTEMTTTSTVEVDTAPGFAIPAGYMQDRKGRFVPASQVEDHDKLMDEFVRNLVAVSKQHRALLTEFKARAFDDCHAFMDLLAEKYDRKVGGKKGNVSFTSFDGSNKVVISMQDTITFGPDLKIAKDIIDELVSEWSEGANENLRAIITDAFQVDKEGNISTSRILSLRRIKIDDARWLEAMNAVSESVLISTSKSYVRFYEKGTKDEMQAISLDFAKL